jgi:hypothetical protein
MKKFSGGRMQSSLETGMTMNSNVIPTITLSGFTCNLQTVAGSALITNPSVNISLYKDRKITITGGGKTLIGWIKSAGSSETYVSELITDPGFDADVSWTHDGTWGIATSIATATTSTTDVTMALTLIAGGLYKMVTTCSGLTGGTYQGIIEATNIGTASSSVSATTWYRNAVTANSLANGIHSATSLSATYTDISLKQVALPSATGVRIVSTQAGGTYNWVSNDGIDANAASYTATITML